tara:strand:- start:164 stop:1444 length:1281 start_codon:yes stop_codon:yes gene_type:complete
VNKFYLYLIFFVLISNCSLVKKDITDENKTEKNIFEKIKPIQKELNPTLGIQLTKFTKGEPYLNNNSNNSGNINFETNFQKKKSLYKFSSIDQFEFNQPELIFTEDNNIIFFDGKGSIFKINKKLKEVWKVNHYSKKERKLNPILYFAQKENNLIIADNLSKLYSINLSNGKLIWSKDNTSPFNSNIKVFKDRFMLVDFESVIRCFSIKDGKEFWNFKTEDPFIKSKKKLSIVLKGEVVYFINNMGDITALNINDGSLVWQTPTQSNVIYQNAFTLDNSDLVFANNSLYLSNNKNELYSIDARSGIIKWKQNINSSLRSTVTENLIFSVSNEGYLFVIDDQSGNILKISNTLKNIKNKKKQIKPIGFIIARNKIYLSLNNGKIIKIDIKTGNQENIFKINTSKISRPYIFDKNMYLIKNNAIVKIF